MKDILVHEDGKKMPRFDLEVITHSICALKRLRRFAIFILTSFYVYISSIKNSQYKILTTLLTKYSTILHIQYHEEQDIMSTPWLLEGKEEEKKVIKY